MKIHILMPPNEPTDKQLADLMKEVAKDVKEKAILAKKLFADKIIAEIKKIR